jgi:hypothetical protein
MKNTKNSEPSTGGLPVALLKRLIATASFFRHHNDKKFKFIKITRKTPRHFKNLHFNSDFNSARNVY